MINAFLRNKSRVLQRHRAATRRRAQSRGYRGERLEARAMLAGDVVNAFHNASMPADVTGDGTVTLGDALVLVSELRQTGPRSLVLPFARSEGEGGQWFLDVNADDMLTLSDPLNVINDLRSEGEGVAVNDQFTVDENIGGSTANTQLDVLANDQRDVGDMLSINEIQLSVNGVLVTAAGEDQVIESESGSEFRIAPGRQSIFYTPRPGFFGEERVTYELNDNNNNITLATATITVSPVNAAVRYRLVTTTLGGVPQSTFEQGEEFLLEVRVQDIRSDLGDTSIQGLEQGFLDVAFNPAFVSLLTDSTQELTFGPDFTEFESAEFSAGEIGEVGAARDITANPPLPPLQDQEVLLFRARFTAGMVGATTISGNHPENSFSQTLVTNPPGGINVFTPGLTPPEDFLVLEFVDAAIVVTPGGFATPDSATVAEETSTTIDVLDNDTGVGLTVQSVSTPANGTAVINNNMVTYTPNLNFVGTDTFTYTASNGITTDMATVTVTVTDVNDPPNAVNDAFSVAFNAPQQSLNVLANDTTAPDAPSAETLTITVVTAPSAGGTAVRNATNTAILYTPPAGEFTTETFTYTISDGRGFTDTATVTINGVPFDEVVAIRLEPSAATVNEGDTITLNVFVDDLRESPTIELGVFQAFVDLMYDASIFSPVAGTDGSVVDFTGQYEPVNVPVFTPGEIQNVGGFHSSLDGPIGGDELFFFSIDFVAVGSGTATFSTTESADQTQFPISLLDPTGATDPVNPADVDFGATQVVVNPPIFDTDVVVSIQAVDPTTGTPVSVLGIGDEFEVRVFVRDTRDPSTIPSGIPGVVSAYIDLLIAELGDAVTLVPGSFEEGPFYDLFPEAGTEIPGVGIDDVGSSTFDVTNFDGNEPQLVFSLDFEATALGEAVFQTAASGNPDNLEIQLFDPSGSVPLTEITFGSTTVFIANADAPIAVSDRYSTFVGNTLTVPAASGVLANDSDPNGNPLTATLQTGAANGTVTLAADGSFTYTPDPDFVGVDTFSYRAVDSTGLESNTALVRIDVVAVSALRANDDVYTTPIGITLTVNSANGVLANDVGQALTASLTTTTSQGVLTFNANGSFTYVPNAGFTGIDTFTYTATDSSGSQQVGRVAIGVGLTAGSMSGRVYIDSNINGIYEPQLGELAIANAEVVITGSTAALGPFYQRTVTTNAAGQYTIGTLLPANYTITEPIPEFLLSGTYTVNGLVTTNTTAGLDSFTAVDILTGGEATVVNFGHMGIHPDFLSFRDWSARTPNTGLIIANDTDGNNLWYAVMNGWSGVSNPVVEVSSSGTTAALTVQTGSGNQTFNIPSTGTPLFRYMGIRPGEGSIIRIEGTLGEASAGEGEGGIDALALDALMAEGFE